MTSIAVVRLCQSLWERAGETEPFPRDLDGLYTWALPLAIVHLPALWAADIRNWLAERGLAGAPGPQRRLRACLIASGDRGFVFVDGSDPPDERRFSLAHEAGHFLLDHQQQRGRLQATLGPQALEVLDGRRPATQEEQIDAILSGVELQPRLHLMERDTDGLACGTTAGAECLADEFAIELLAPETDVLARLQTLPAGSSYAERERAAESLLLTHFGLPQPVAGPYARRLLRLRTGGPSTAEWLGLSVLPSPSRGEGPGMRGSTRGCRGLRQRDP